MLEFCINMSTSSWHRYQASREDGSADGTIALTAANGEKRGAETKRQAPDSDNIDRGIDTLTGGTGQFRDALGGMYVEGVVISDVTQITADVRGIVQ